MTLNAMTDLQFEEVCWHVRKTLLATEPLMTGEWQSQDISDKPMLATREITNFSFDYRIPEDALTLAQQTGANMPWAEDHFRERVSGEPLNPPPSNEWWPYAQQGNADHKKGQKFSHTYPERMWPKQAGEEEDQAWDINSETGRAHRGIRFAYGDLQDVVQQLADSPLTRQAYLPIWFPEDTGAVHGERVPCTLGYHFMIRHNRLQITYYIRSCDFVRHFRDDVYMAGRLAQWMVDQLNDIWGRGAPHLSPLKVDKLYMHIVSFHCFEGDVVKLQVEQRQAEREAERQRSIRLMEALG